MPSRAALPRAGGRRLRAGAVAQAAPATGSLRFVKYQGLGNDFILVDNRHQSEPVLSSDQAAKLCDRNFGIGGDGVIFALPGGPGEDYKMRIFNSDGSEPEMCGNGIRCLARFIAVEDKAAPKAYKVGTLGGMMIPEVRADGQVAVDMGEPIFEPAKVPTTLAATKDGRVVQQKMRVGDKDWTVTAVSMGNPHCIIFTDPSGNPLDVNALDLASMGPSFENNAAFPKRTNTEFTQVLSRSRLRMRVWERGAGATLACGTGACATVVAAVLEGRADRKCVVDLPGGPLEIEWRESDNRIIMTGPAEPVFAGMV